MLTLAARFRYQEEIKKSRFIASAAPAASPEEAFAFLGEVRDPQATHNCWSYRIGDLYRFSDDGEPGGTAGRPILAAIERRGFDRVMVVVTRFFGGIKLGAGGLARAYGGVASRCLSLAQSRTFRHFVKVRIESGFSEIGSLYAALGHIEWEKLEEQFTPEGLVLLLHIEKSAMPRLEALLGDAGRGLIRLRRVDGD